MRVVKECESGSERDGVSDVEQRVPVDYQTTPLPGYKIRDQRTNFAIL